MFEDRVTICTGKRNNLEKAEEELEKAEEPEIKLPTSVGSYKNQEFQKNTYCCFIDYAKPLTV